MKRLVVATGARSEYGLLRPFLKRAREKNLFEVTLVVSGTHLSDRHGRTIGEIEGDGYEIAATVESIAPDDSPAAAAQWFGKGISGFAKAFADLAPDMLLVEGDRVEGLAAVLAAGYSGIPVAHSGGGDETKTIDNSARHAMSFFSQLHFVSTEGAKKRLIAFGLDPRMIHTVGGLGIDALCDMSFSERGAVLKDLGLAPDAKYLLLSFHPEPEHHASCGGWMKTLLTSALATGLSVVVTHPNSDPGSSPIIEAIEACAAVSPERVRSFKSLGQVRYLNAMNCAECLIGNSSGALYEAPTLKLPVVNVGMRQEGRLKADNVISCGYGEAEIRAALERALTDAGFRAKLAGCANPYGDGKAAMRMVKTIGEHI